MRKPEDSALAPSDPEGDWAPAINEVVRAHLLDLAASSDSIRFQKTWAEVVELGHSRVRYRCDSPIHCFGVELRGVRKGTEGGVELWFPAGSPGLVVHYPRTVTGDGSFNDPTDPFDGFGGQLHASDIRLIGAGQASESGAHGVRAYHVVHLERVQSWDFGGHGFYIRAVARPPDGDPHPVSNANGWQMTTCTATRNGRCGFYIDGPDVNAGTSRKLHAQQNKEWGIYDSSFLGNTHVSPQADANDGGAIKCDGAAATAVINPYIEQWDPIEGGTIDCPFPHVVIGGHLGGPVTPTTYVVGSPHKGLARFQPATTNPPGVGLWTRFEAAPQPLVLRSEGISSADTIRRKYKIRGPHAGWIVDDMANSDFAISEFTAPWWAKTTSGHAALLGRKGWPDWYEGPRKAYVRFDDLDSLDLEVQQVEGLELGSRIINHTPRPGSHVGAILCEVDGVKRWRRYGPIE